MPYGTLRQADAPAVVVVVSGGLLRIVWRIVWHRSWIAVIHVRSGFAEGSEIYWHLGCTYVSCK